MPIFLIFEDWWQKIKGCAMVTLVIASALASRHYFVLSVLIM
jgi:hypothetical protein